MSNKFFDFEVGFDEKPRSKKHRNNVKATLANFFCDACDYEELLPIKTGKKKHICPVCGNHLTREMF